MKQKPVVVKPHSLQSFTQKLILLDSGTLKPKERVSELRALASLASTFDQWLEVYFREKEKSALEQEALKKLAKLPATNQELLDVLEFAPTGSNLRYVLQARLWAQGVTELGTYASPLRVTFHSYSEKTEKPKNPAP